MTPYNFDTTRDILTSENSSLKSLAKMSGFSPATFYCGADLTNLDLSDSDLSGLNFQDADLRGSRLHGAILDKGSLNGAKLDPEFEHLKDEFDFSFLDITSNIMKLFYVFGRFRSETLERAIKFTGKAYWEFSRDSHISEQTLRRARRNNVVSFETMESIAKTVLSKSPDTNPSFFKADVYLETQPLIEVLAMDVKGNFTQVSKSEFAELSEVAKALNRSYNSEGSIEEPRYIYRNSPDTFRWHAKHGYHLMQDIEII